MKPLFSLGLVAGVLTPLITAAAEPGTSPREYSGPAWSPYLVIDRHILYIHHVTEDAGHLAWDIGVLGSGVVLMTVGLMLIRSAKEGPLAASSRVRRTD